MEMQQMRYVVALAETGSFTRAAARCHVSQPSLSQQVRQLEEELGHPLFHRLGRRAVPTEAGQRVVEGARRVLHELAEVTSELRDDREGIRGRIVVGALPTLAPYLVPPLLDRCRTLYPELKVETYEDFLSYLTEELLEGSIDLAFVSLPVADERLVAEPLFEEPLLLLVPLGHPLATRPEVVVADLSDQPLILLGERSTAGAQIQRFMGSLVQAPRVVHRCAQVETVKALVAAGLGVAILPQVVRQLADKRRIVYRTLTGAAPVRRIQILRHRQRYQTRAAQRLIGLARELLAAVPASGTGEAPVSR